MMNEIIIDRLETHDRLLEFKKQGDTVAKGVQDCINNRPEEFKNYPFYIFAHARTAENGRDKRLIYQPRLRKPKAQTNSMLFKAYPPTDKIKIIWMIPDRALWPNFKQKMITEQAEVSRSIHQFQYNRKELEKNEPDDLQDELINQIYTEMAINQKAKLLKKEADKIQRIKNMGIT
jgi:hypothetical protein